MKINIIFSQIKLCVISCLFSSSFLIAYSIPHSNELEKLSQALSFLENDQEHGCALARPIVENVVVTLCPQQKRVAELTLRLDQAQKEMAEKVKQKVDQTPPLISFVIPCYNRADVISQTIDSIYAQNLTFPFEIIAVDDCSKDNSYELLLEYEKQHDNFFAFRNKENRKAPTTRNYAIAYARGTYIINADSDDVFEPNSIEPMFRAMIKKGYQTAFFEELRFFNDNDKASDSIGRTIPPNQEVVLAPMLKELYLAVCAGNRIFTKQSWLKSGGYLEEPGHDSWAFSYMLLVNGYTGYVHPQSGYRHRLWTNKTNMWFEDFRNNVMDISPMLAVFSNPEIFSFASMDAMKKYKSHKDDQFIFFLSRELLANRVAFTPTANTIIQGYWYENEGQYEKALDCYLNALENGPHLVNLNVRAIRVAIWLEERAIAVQLLHSLLRPSS